MLKLLGRITSINVRKVVWTLNELGLAYERADWGLPLRDPKTPEFLQLNPNGQVPVLIDEGFTLWESNAVMLYLAEGSPLVPTERHERALMMQWLSWQVSDLAPSWSYAFLALGRPTPGYDDEAQIAGSLRRWTARMAILEATLADGRGFIAGDSFSLADVALGVGAHRWLQMPIDRPGFPAVDAYHARLSERPAASEALDKSVG